MRSRVGREGLAVNDVDWYVLWVAMGVTLLYVAAVLLALYCLALPFLAVDPM